MCHSDYLYFCVTVIMGTFVCHSDCVFVCATVTMCIMCHSYYVYFCVTVTVTVAILLFCSDYGYYRKSDAEVCIEDPSVKDKEINICLRGHEEKFVPLGYDLLILVKPSLGYDLLTLVKCGI